MGYAFISYSTKNRTSADEIRKIFQKNNIDIWMAPYSIPVGSKYAAEITKGIRECSCFVLLLSSASQVSEAVDSEVELAVVNYKKRIIVIELEKVVLNDAFAFYINNKQMISLYKIDENTQEVQRVVEAVRLHTKETKEMISLHNKIDDKIQEEKKGTKGICIKESVMTVYAMDDDAYFDQVFLEYNGYWKNVKKIIFDKNIKKIRNSMFTEMEQLEEIVFPEGLEEIGEHAFRGCTSLYSVHIPQGVSRIGKGAFMNCSLLSVVNIPTSVRYIGWGAFRGTRICSLGKKIMLHKDCFLEDDAFDNMEVVEKIIE